LHVAIIGNGIAGVSAAQSIRRLQPDWRITLISGESTFHYSRPALMYMYMGHMRYQDTKPYEDSYWKEQRIDLLRAWVTGIDVANQRLDLHDSTPLAYDKLLLATGSKSNKFGWPGQDLDGVQGLYSLMDLKLLQENTSNCRRAVIVGGGLIGIELAEMLHFQGIAVSFLVREQSYWDNVLPAEESAMVSDLIRERGFDLRTTTMLDRIEDDGNGHAGAVVTDGGDQLECQLVGLTAGISPNLDLVVDSPIETGRGILVDRGFRTNTENVYAAGDCAEILAEDGGRNLLQQVWYSGKRQGTVAGEVIAGEDRSYDPGIWYNSAKFLDLEYQTYGQVGFRVPGEESLYWQHPTERQAVRLVHVDGRIIGLNFMGLRFSHGVAEKWIARSASVDRVLAGLHEGNFQPEFTPPHDAPAAGFLRMQWNGRAA
jgi:NADPH-dependent 2,4-dienoyl-CoA reductase/sulfur reductase-like enzyme